MLIRLKKHLQLIFLLLFIIIIHSLSVRSAYAAVLRITGQVKTDSGLPISGATIEVHCVDDSCGTCCGVHTGCGTIKTGSDGRYSVTSVDIPKSALIIESKPAGYNNSSAMPSISNGGGAFAVSVDRACSPSNRTSTGPSITFYDNLIPTPTLAATNTPIPSPTRVPTRVPTVVPSRLPTAIPSRVPTATRTPTRAPSITIAPTIRPSPTIVIPSATLAPPTNTPIPGCSCSFLNTCTSTCQFNYWPTPMPGSSTGINYERPIRCTRPVTATVPTLSQQNKNSYCNRSDRTRGDADGDNAVTIDDYVYFIRSQYSQSVSSQINADFNGDGQIGAEDLSIFQMTAANSGLLTR